MVVKSKPRPWPWLWQPLPGVPGLAPLLQSSFCVSPSLHLPKQPRVARTPGSLSSGMRKVAACKEQGGLWGQVDHVRAGVPLTTPPAMGRLPSSPGRPSNPETLTPGGPESGHPELFVPVECSPSGTLRDCIVNTKAGNPENSSLFPFYAYLSL